MWQYLAEWGREGILVLTHYYTIPRHRAWSQLTDQSWIETEISYMAEYKYQLKKNDLIIHCASEFEPLDIHYQSLNSDTKHNDKHKTRQLQALTTHYILWPPCYIGCICTGLYNMYQLGHFNYYCGINGPEIPVIYNSKDLLLCHNVASWGLQSTMLRLASMIPKRVQGLQQLRVCKGVFLENTHIT